MNKSFAIFLFLLLLPGIAKAQTELRISPCDQTGINQAIDTVYNSGGGTVYLTSGVYEVNGPVIIKSNIKLTGDPDAIIRVSSSSSQFFTGQIGIICNPEEVISNVEIDSFQVDGNIKNLPRSYDSTEGHDRDCEKLILIGGWSSQFGNNIRIHDLKLYNSFSDAVYVRFSNGVEVYNNIISNAQHEGFYLSCVTNSLIYNNKIAGICSDCGRLDNCQYCKVYDNLFFSYNGETWGAWAGAANGLQIGDTGSSNGYTSSVKPLSSKNIEVYNNTFADPGRKAIWLHEGTENVYIHDNSFIDASGLETSGVPIGDISINNPPSVDDSLSVFDLLKHYQGKTSINDYQDRIKNDPVKTQEDKKAFFSPVMWFNLLIIFILLLGIRINLRAVFKW